MVLFKKKKKKNVFQWLGAYVSYKVARKINLPKTFCIVLDNQVEILTTAFGEVAAKHFTASVSQLFHLTDFIS